MKDIKIFKSDVTERSAAEAIQKDLQSHFQDYDVSFDLEDCDNVLRVESKNGAVDESAIKEIVRSYGYQAERLT